MIFLNVHLPAQIFHNQSKVDSNLLQEERNRNFLYN